MTAEAYGNEINAANPWDLTSVMANVALYVAGTTILCKPLMAFAVRSINATTEAIEPVIHTRFRSPEGDSSMLRVEDGLRNALAMMYGQPYQRTPDDLAQDGNHWFALRLALAKLGDVVLPYISLNQATAERMKSPEWQDVIGPAAEDIRILSERGLLAPVDPALMEAGRRALDQNLVPPAPDAL